MSDSVNHPPHYNKHPSGVECIEIVRHMNFNLGNAIKYIWRAGEKDSTATIEDLNKALWYISDEIERLGGVVGEVQPDPIRYYPGYRPDWENAPEGAKWFTVDADGKSCWWGGEYQPRILGAEWNNGSWFKSCDLRFTFPNPNLWRTALIERESDWTGDIPNER